MRSRGPLCSRKMMMYLPLWKQSGMTGTTAGLSSGPLLERKKKRSWGKSREVNGAGTGFGACVLQAAPEGPGGLSLEKRSLIGDPLTVYSSLALTWTL